MGDFKKSWPKTSRNEGGIVNNSKDKGKLTYRGIASAFFPNWEGWQIVHKTIADLGITDTLDCSREIRVKIDKALALIPSLDEMVQQFYKKEFWDKLGLDNEPDQLICDEVFDTAVNMGVGTAKKFYNEAKGKTSA